MENIARLYNLTLESEIIQSTPYRTQTRTSLQQSVSVYQYHPGAVGQQGPTTISCCLKFTFYLRTVALVALIETNYTRAAVFISISYFVRKQVIYSEQFSKN